MENSKHSELQEQPVVDFESGIDTWVIDKDEPSESKSKVENQNEKNHGCLQLRSMDKENIKHCVPNRSSLRSFRIRKPTSYQELSMSSDSDSDSPKKCSFDRDKHSSLVKAKPRRENGQSNNRSLSKPISNCKLSTCYEFGSSIKDRESLSSEEISHILSEVEESDSLQGKKRERLHSIENVSPLVDKKEKADTPPKTNSVSFKCSICNSECHSLDDLRNHESSHKLSSNRAWNKKDFLSTFKSHLVSQGVMPVTEPDNTRRTSDLTKDPKSKKNGKTSVVNKKILFCKLCPYSCFELLKYKIHQIMFHSENEIFTCEYCDYQTRQCGNLATHIRIHFQIDCPYCTFRFSVRADLDDHVAKQHADRFEYSCSKCDFCSKSQSKFKKHQKVHLVNKKYQCRNCKSYFSNKCNLKLHMKQHLTKNKKLFICDLCGSKFNHKIGLKGHMKSHLEQRKCKICKLSFTNENKLKLHNCLNNDSFKCQHCPFVGNDSSCLKKHICIDKLYEVHKTSLNFLDECLEKNSELKDKIKDNKKNTRSQLIIKNRLSVFSGKNNNSDKEANSKKSKHKRYRRDRHKLLSLRQNLPCRKIQNIVEEETKKISTEHLKVVKKCDNLKQMTTNNKKSKKNKSSKQNCAHQNESSVLSVQRQKIAKKYNTSLKKIKKENLSKSLDVVKVLFGKEPPLKDFVVEPVRFKGEQFVQCYYQCQQPTSPRDHLERHLRQSSLLSCRFCRYRTNSEQLLRRHQAKKHRWDPAVVNLLFS